MNIQEFSSLDMKHILNVNRINPVDSDLNEPQGHQVSFVHMYLHYLNWFRDKGAQTGSLSNVDWFNWSQWDVSVISEAEREVILDADEQL